MSVMNASHTRMKDHHISIFDGEADDACSAGLPDCEMCAAVGDTPEEALREKGLPIPEPRYRPMIYLTS